MDGMRLAGVPSIDRKDSPCPGALSSILHPAFSALAARTRFRMCGGTELPFGVFCPAPGQVVISALFEPGPQGWPILRFALELAWLAALPGLHPDACLILGARSAGGFMACLPRRSASPSPILALFDELMGDLPPSERLDMAASQLRRTHILAVSPQHPLEPGRLHRLLTETWDFAAACEALLVSGGDDRLRLDPATGLNRYGCTPWPRPNVIAFASSTASSISAEALGAAEACRQHLIADALSEPADQVLEHRSDQTCDRVLSYFDIADIAGCVLAASGTDAALLLTALLSAEAPASAMTSILMSPEETGSGVPDAVCACHFAACTASGDAVTKGGAVEDAHILPRLVTIPVRDSDGAPRSPCDVAQNCREAIRQAARDGRVVLHAIDGSKTGLSVPDRETCVALGQEFAGSLDIAVDACQARLEPELVRSYLQQGFVVLVTGSKFFAAPGFCGAVLMPRERLTRILHAGQLPVGLRRYASLSGGTLRRRCPGLLLRWEAALHDMDRLRALPPATIAHHIERFGDVVQALVQADDRLTLVEAPRPAGFGWSDRRSVMTFTVRGKQGLLGMDALRSLYKAMACDLASPCQIGQPVAIGQAGLAGLRVSLGAAQIADGETLDAPLATLFATLRLLIDRPELVPAA